jgi:hypothetical protein
MFVLGAGSACLESIIVGEVCLYKVDIGPRLQFFAFRHRFLSPSLVSDEANYSVVGIA